VPSYSLDLSFLPDWIPSWVVGLALIAAALAAAVGLHGWVVRVISRGLSHRGDFARSLLVRTKAPSRFALRPISEKLVARPVIEDVIDVLIPPGINRIIALDVRPAPDG